MATAAATSKQPGFWDKCNNLYMTIAVAVGLLMTFISFKVALKSYHLSIWTGKNGFHRTMYRNAGAKAAATARAFEQYEDDNIDEGFRAGVRRRRVATFQLETSDYWDSLNSPVSDSDDERLVTNSTNNDAEDILADDDNDSLWLPAGNCIPTVPYLEKSFRTDPQPGFEETHAASNTARLIYFYLTLVQRHLRQPTRFFPVRVSAGANSEWASSQGSWTVYTAAPCVGVSEDSDLQPLQQAFTDLLTYSAPFEYQATPSELIDWTLTVPSQACPLIRSHLCDKGDSYYQYLHQAGSHSARSGVAKDLAARYALVEPYETVTFANFTAPLLGWGSSNGPHVLVIVECDGAAFEHVLDQLHVCLDRGAIWQQHCHEYKWQLQRKGHDASGVRSNICSGFDLCTHKLGSEISNDLKELESWQYEKVRDLASSYSVAMDLRNLQTDWYVIYSQFCGNQAPIDTMLFPKLAIQDTRNQPSQADPEAIRKSFTVDENVSGQIVEL